MENAIKEVQRDLQIMYDRHTLIVREFTYMVRRLNLNVTAEGAWKDFLGKGSTSGGGYICHCIFPGKEERRRQYSDH